MKKNKFFRNALLLIMVISLSLLFILAVFGPVKLLHALKARTFENSSIVLLMAAIALLLLMKSCSMVNSRKWDLFFLLVIFLTVFQIDAYPPFVESDGVGYFAYLHTLYIDRDLDFVNEYADLDAYKYGVHTYADAKAKIPQTTFAGIIPNLFSIGPTLLWYPFYGVTDIFYRTSHPQRTGYETPYLQSIQCALLFYGFIGAFMLFISLSRFFSRAVSMAAVLTILLLSPLYFYLKNLPFFSQVYSFFAISLFLFFFAKYQDSKRIGHWAAFGLLLGFATLMRWQNAVFITIPGMSALLGFWYTPKDGRKPFQLLARIAVLGAGFVFALLPQLLAFYILYGKIWLIPQGGSFMTIWPRWLWQVLFSSFHGLFHWHPLLFAGLLGFFLHTKNKASAGRPVFYSSAAGFAMQIYVNGSIAQYHGGGSFGGRRFCDSLSFLAFGIANFFDHILESRIACSIALVLGNAFFLLNVMMERAWVYWLLPRAAPYPFPKLVQAAGQAFFHICHNNFKLILFFVFFIIFVNLYVIHLLRLENRLRCGSTLLREDR